MKRIVYLSNILYHDWNNKPTNHIRFIKLMEPSIRLVSGLKTENFTELKNEKGETFDRNIFFKLSGIENIKKCYFSYNLEKITQQSLDYFYSFINQDDFILGIELDGNIRKILSERNIKFINFWIHSFHLFDDMCFMVNTNDISLFERIKQFQIPQEKFYLYADIAKNILNNKFGEVDINNNSCLFAGQTYNDKSIEKDGIFLNITHFEEEIKELEKKYNTIYYIPHPYAPVEQNNDVNNFLKKHPKIEVIKNVPTYAMLASDKIKEVIAISSSVLYEAQFFNKKIKYLYKSMFNIDTEFRENTFISVYNDYLNPKFWSAVLDGYFYIDKTKADFTIYDKNKSRLRDILNIWHGYKQLSEISVIEKHNKYETELKNIAVLMFYIHKILANITFGELKKEIINKKYYYKEIMTLG